jgi:hypothetical protein
MIPALRFLVKKRAEKFCGDALGGSSRIEYNRDDCELRLERGRPVRTVWVGERVNRRKARRTSNIEH